MISWIVPALGCVSIHAPTRGATEEVERMNEDFKFQSTHPLGVRLHHHKYLYLFCQVSIHAPTRGATASVLVLPENVQVSIHAPTRGATRQNLEYYRIKKFQSTHPLGVRPYDATDFLFVLVSIHAPTRGATKRKNQKMSLPMFQSTHPLGVRLSATAMMLVPTGFQSTHPLGVRLMIHQKFNKIYTFQSTHPLGVRRYFP